MQLNFDTNLSHCSEPHFSRVVFGVAKSFVIRVQHNVSIHTSLTWNVQLNYSFIPLLLKHCDCSIAQGVFGTYNKLKK